MSKVIKIKFVNENTWRREECPDFFINFIKYVNGIMKGKDINFMNNYNVNYKFIEESTKKQISNDQDFQYIKNNIEGNSIKIIIYPQNQINLLNPGKLYTNKPNMNEETAIEQINNEKDNIKIINNNSEIIRGILNEKNLQEKEENLFEKQFDKPVQNYQMQNTNDNKNDNVNVDINEQIKDTIAKIVKSKIKNLEEDLINDIYKSISQNEENELSKLNNNQKIIMSNIKKNNEKQIHYGISCDNCHCQNIIGPRFKCSICENYNLCSNCEEISKHDINHIFIKIKKPNDSNLNINSTLYYITKDLNFSSSPNFLKFKRDSTNIQDITLTNTGKVNWKKGFYFKCLKEFSELIGDKISFSIKVEPGKEIHAQLIFDKKKNDENLSQIDKNKYVSYWQMFTDYDEPFGESAKLVIQIED